MIQSNISTATKFCSDCGQLKSIDEFRRRRSNGEARHNQCRPCFNRYPRSHRAVARDRAIGQFAARARRESSASKLAVMANAMVQRFGGLGAFVEAWKLHIDEASTNKPGSKPVLDSFAAIAQLIRLVGEWNDRARPDVSNLSDEELDSEFQRRTKALIQEHPEIAVECARQLGWEVVPMSSVSSV